MRVYETWQDIGKRYQKLVVGLGNFDGVHLGHKKLISDLVAQAQTIGGTSLVFTFSPHPAAVLNPEHRLPMLLTSQAKEKMIARLGVDILLKVPFTREFARMKPEEFIEKVLYRGLGVHTVFVGYNYTFGYKARGTIKDLQHYSTQYGYKLVVTPPVHVDGQPVSSTLIRNLIQDGEVTQAAKYLGYYPFVEGPVVTGERRGITLGFPTANLKPDQELLLPASGVYTARVKVDQEMFLGVANIGVRPTFYSHNVQRNVEVHLLDFCGDLYGKFLRVCFTKRLREEKRFQSPAELIEQINRDIQIARGEYQEHLQTC